MMEYIQQKSGRELVFDAKAQKKNQDRKINLGNIDKCIKLSFSAKNKNKWGRENRQR